MLTVYHDIEKVSQDNARKYFESNPDLMKELEEKIKEKIANGSSVGDEDDDIGDSDFNIEDLNLD